MDEEQGMTGRRYYLGCGELCCRPPERVTAQNTRRVLCESPGLVRLGKENGKSVALESYDYLNSLETWMGTLRARTIGEVNEEIILGRGILYFMNENGWEYVGLRSEDGSNPWDTNVMSGHYGLVELYFMVERVIPPKLPSPPVVWNMKSVDGSKLRQRSNDEFA